MPHFDNITIRPPLEMDYHSDNQEVFFTEEEIIYLRNLFESNQDMPQGCQLISSPLMDVVQGATTSSSRQTRHETGNSSRRTYAYWSEEDVKQLIIAVREHGVRRKSWASIVQSPYFRDKGRDTDHLLEKWRHMMTANLSKCDPQMKELYIWARDVDAKLT